MHISMNKTNMKTDMNMNINMNKTNTKTDMNMNINMNKTNMKTNINMKKLEKFSLIEKSKSIMKWKIHFKTV